MYLGGTPPPPKKTQNCQLLVILPLKQSAYLLNQFPSDWLPLINRLFEQQLL